MIMDNYDPIEDYLDYIEEKRTIEGPIEWF